MRTNSTPAVPFPEAGRPASRIWGTLDAFVESGPLLGRKVANNSFLEALLSLDPFDSYHFFPSSPEADAALRVWLQEHFAGLLRRKAVCIGPRHSHLPDCLSRIHYHCMHLSDGLTSFAQLTQLRNATAVSLFPITGVTHSLSYERFMPEYLKHLWSGVSPRDALIVTSESVRLVMEAVFSGLRREYGLSKEGFPGPRLEHIPLGVATQTLPDPEERWNADSAGKHNARRAGENSDTSQGQDAREMRAGLGLNQEVMFLCLGRICPYSKMDLMPVFSALQRAEALGLPKDGYALVLAGWIDEDQELPGALQQYAQSMGIRLVCRLRPSNEERRALYAAADVFLSPSDNIQESFGLTVAEAGAAALPVIASDFDGYRTIVVHEETGLLVPTLGFADTTETDILALFWFDNQYHLKLSQSCALHVPSLAQALARLGTDSALRKRMGEAGRKRVLSHFSWDIVLKRYLSFWEELAAHPITAQKERQLRETRHPQAMRFGEYFHGHFSQTLDPAALKHVVLQRTRAGTALYQAKLPLTHYAGMEIILDPEAVRRMLLTARKPVPGAHLMRVLLLFFQERSPASFVQERAAFTLLWALKHDYLEYVGNDLTLS